MGYYSLNRYLKETFGTKVYKLALNGGMTCPSRDGTLGSRGCIFCSAGGSGDFAAPARNSITEQIEQAKAKVADKIKDGRYIAYFQAYTNTYAPVEYLERIFTEAVYHKEIVALSVATRPDCLPEDVLELLGRLNQVKPVWVELGLQSVKAESAAYIRRGYDLECFERAVLALKKRGISVIVHIILGLPGETKDDMLKTVEYVGRLHVQGVKLQLLHVLKGTDLAEDYNLRLFRTLTMEEYIELLIDCIEHLPRDVVIHRLTGDGPKRLLIAPMWSADKKKVLNAIKQRMEERGCVQGRYCSPIH